ncbi:MAG: hypothetical protein KDK48_01725 [Chlamydiia bacterium]|nr:hypothetical protein [Chlamydiia bacterium]
MEAAPFTLPNGIQAYVSAVSQGKWVLLAGRSNGLHGFSNVGNNFPPALQNRTVIVVDPATGNSWTRSLTEPSSGLTSEQIDALSTTAAQAFQKGNTLYIVGGYGINSVTGQMETKSTLTALTLDKLIDWVINGTTLIKDAVRQVSHPLLKVTGGFLFQNSDHDPFLLMLGQNFQGLYTDSSNGQYTQQIRQFWLNDNGKTLRLFPKESGAILADYRRRDLNILPIMLRNKPAYTAFSGVFTLTTGVWTVPITIFPDGSSFQPDPEAATTFKQAMNNYNCPAFGLYSVATEEMFAVFPGGISFGYFDGGVFTTDSEIPFINQVTTIRIDNEEKFTQHLMSAEYPGPLLYGAEAQFFPAANTPLFYNGVIQLDALPKTPTVIGYIVGGIMSTVPNTSSPADSTASPAVFTVTLIPK